MGRIEIEFSRRFLKNYKKLPPKIKTAFKKRIKLFESKPFSPILNNHSLKGRLNHHRSINITGDWRAIYSPTKSGKKVTFKLIGTHSQLYK